MTLKNLHDQNINRFISMANKVAEQKDGYDVLRLSNSKYYVEVEKHKEGRDFYLQIDLYQGNPSDLYAKSFYIDGSSVYKDELTRMELESCFDELMNYSLYNYIGSTDEKRNDRSVDKAKEDKRIAEDKAFEELFGFTPSEMINEEALDEALADPAKRESLANLINAASSEKLEPVSTDDKSRDQVL